MSMAITFTHQHILIMECRQELRRNVAMEHIVLVSIEAVHVLIMEEWQCGFKNVSLKYVNDVLDKIVFKYDNRLGLNYDFKILASKKYRFYFIDKFANSF